MFDFFEDLFDEEWVAVIFFIGIGLFLIQIVLVILSSPLILIIISYGFFLLFYFGLILVSILVGRFISLMFENLILSIFNEVVEYILKGISIAGIIFSAYLFIKGLFVVEWSEWGIIGFIQSMTSEPIYKLNQGTSLFDPNVFSKYWFMIKALYINIGRHVFEFIWYFFLPWSIVSTGYTILSE